MLNLEEINNTIEQLENGDTTFDNCIKLASLYIVRDNLQKSIKSLDNDVIIQEYNDILPEYKKYADIKRKYQLGELSEKAVQRSVKELCTEIEEFIHILYSSTNTIEERQCIVNMCESLHF